MYGHDNKTSEIVLILKKCEKWWQFSFDKSVNKQHRGIPQVLKWLDL
jgi:hypothetical protein